MRRRIGSGMSDAIVSDVERGVRCHTRRCRARRVAHGIVYDGCGRGVVGRGGVGERSEEQRLSATESCRSDIGVTTLISGSME